MTTGKQKVCYLVVGHTPTREKQLILFKLLSTLKTSGNPIVLIQHTDSPPHIQNLVEYSIVDSKNDVMNYYPIKGGNDFNLHLYWNFDNGSVTLGTQYASYLKYHGLAAMSLFFNGLLNVKALGYDICHLIEYDTGIESIDEFIENEKILTEGGCSSVYYHLGPLEQTIYPQCSSYNLNHYSFEDLDWSKKRMETLDIIQSDSYGINNGMVEVALYEILHRDKKPFKKDRSNFESSKIEIDLSGKMWGEDIVSASPYVLSETEQVGIFVYYNIKKQDGTRKLNFVVNGKTISREITTQGEWFLFDACHLNDLEEIEFYVDGKLIKRYDFINEIMKEHFKQHSVMYFK